MAKAIINTVFILLVMLITGLIIMTSPLVTKGYQLSDGWRVQPEQLDTISNICLNNLEKEGFPLAIYRIADISMQDGYCVVEENNFAKGLNFSFYLAMAAGFVLGLIRLLPKGNRTKKGSTHDKN